MMPVGRSMSWDDFETTDILQYLPFEEAQLGDRTLDIALFDFGERHVGRMLSASDIHVLFGRGIIMDEGLDARYLVLIGWWTVFFPWDWEAVLQAMYASMTFPCIPVWTAWLTGGTSGTRTWVDYLRAWVG
jgi:hypothetical protein